MTLWVFGYGSLLWNPGFDPIEQVIGTVEGYSRSFCMRSIHHRGTEEDPGLVLALDADPVGLCHGVAMQVAHGAEDAVLAYLRERELISSAYLERELEIVFHGGGSAMAVTYVIDTEHEQYMAGMSLEEQARIIARAVGGRGPNDEYLYNTAAHLADLNLADEDLDWLVARVKDLTAA